jgi:urea transport system permease protein
LSARQNPSACRFGPLQIAEEHSELFPFNQIATAHKFPRIIHQVKKHSLLPAVRQNGPKGRDNSAQGNALGFRSQTVCGLKGRDTRRVHSFIATLILLFALALLAPPTHAAPATAAETREIFVKAALSENADERVVLLQRLVGANDALVGQALTAWRGGALYLWETNDTKIPFFLEALTDSEGNAHGIKVFDGSKVLNPEGKPALFTPGDLTSIDADSKLRRALKAVLDLFALGNENPKMRRDAVTKLGQEQNPDYLPHFQTALATEKDSHVRNALDEAILLTQVASEDAKTRVNAIQKLGVMRSINSLNFLQKIVEDSKKEPGKLDKETQAAADLSVFQIERYVWWGNFFGTAFRGLSLSAVLLVAALGLAITFGLMGVINMAHGEVMAVGAYTAYVTQNMFRGWGAKGYGFDAYFVVALLLAFIAAAIVGLILERGVIRFLYKRPLESLLATWGVSLVLQQAFRAIFGSANVQVDSPAFLSGGFTILDQPYSFVRTFIIIFAVLILIGVYLLLTRTSLGLQIRAVMQNRTMASCIGVRTDRVNMMTFGLGSGLAGLAGACFSQIANVGPSLGQNYIIDCFMVVVLGGVGNVVGTVTAAGGIGVADQILQPWLGAVMGKITVLAAIILFLQWRPAGLFSVRGRGLED